VLLRLGELTLLTDPALDPVGIDHQSRVPGTHLTIPLHRSSVPVLPSGGLPHLDAVLLSHDSADGLAVARSGSGHSVQRPARPKSGGCGHDAAAPGRRRTP
jgi:L-ascorbate metabolism protein UlaG (beta-lactamase superfamily)